MLTKENVLEWCRTIGVISEEQSIKCLPLKYRPPENCIYSAPKGRTITEFKFFDDGILVTLDDGTREWRKC